MKYNKVFAFFGIAMIGLSSCGDDEAGTTGIIDVNFKMTYEGQPLVIGDTYTHDGKSIVFQRLSFFISDMKMMNDASILGLFDVEYINLTNSHTTFASAQEGLTYNFAEVPTGTYTGLSYNIGVDPNKNTTIPTDYTTPPLNDANEYWADWSSYIFVKIEGRIDLDNSGDLETGFVMHLGSDNAFRTKSFSNSVTVRSDETTNLDFTIDVFDIFNNGSKAYDFEAVPRTHSLDFLDEINFVADGLARATNL